MVNFPINCIYDTLRNNIMVFYRRGQYLSIDLENDNEELQFKKLADDAIEQYYFVANQILIMRKSKAVWFFQYNEEKKEWEKYH